MFVILKGHNKACAYCDSLPCESVTDKWVLCDLVYDVEGEKRALSLLSLTFTCCVTYTGLCPLWALVYPLVIVAFGPDVIYQGPS